METMTVARGLTEIGLLQKRIDKKIDIVRLVDLFQNRDEKMTLGTKITTEAFERKAKADLQSVEDLIERRKKIKSAILISNSKTMVTIGGVEYTVIESIERKNSIVDDQKLLGKMKTQIAVSKQQVEEQKPGLDQNISEMLKNNLGTDKKPSEDDYKNVAEPFLKANKLNILDPCDIESRIEKLDENIDVFLAEVDFTLSESNAITKIEFDAPSGAHFVEKEDIQTLDKKEDKD